MLRLIADALGPVALHYFSEPALENFAECELEYPSGSTSFILAPESTSTDMAILLPGHLDFPTYPHMLSHAATLLELGLFPVILRYPGTNDGEDLSHYTIAEILEAIASLVIFGDRIGMHSVLFLGHSMGGLLGAYAATMPRPIGMKLSGVVRLMSPYRMGDKLTDAELAAWRDRGTRTSTRTMPDGTVRTYEVPFSFIEDTREHNLLERPRLTAPMLSVAGAFDEVISPKVVARGHMHCMAEGSASPFVLMPAMPHDHRLLPRTIEAVDIVIRDFVSSHVVLGPH